MKKGKKQSILAVVCDGIGGLSQGQQASSYVVRQLANWFMSQGYKQGSERQKKRIQQLCFQIHEELKEYGKENKIRLGTTVTMVLMNEKKMTWFHVGDGRLYLLQNNKIRKITKEHQEKDGKLNRAVGVGEWYLPDMGSRRVKKGDRFLLCTDGFYRNLDMEELRIWGKREVESDVQANRMLKQIFHKKLAIGEKDNISAIYFGYTKRGKI